MFHEEFEIKYFYEGTSTLIIGSDTVSVKAGDIVVVNPYEFHATIDVGVDKGKYYLINLSLDFLGDNSANGLNLRHLLLGQGIRFQNVIHYDKKLQNKTKQI